MLDVSVAHLEQKLFEFEILQFLNLAYFLHIKANFKRKCLNTIENDVFSNEIIKLCLPNFTFTYKTIAFCIQNATDLFSLKYSILFTK